MTERSIDEIVRMLSEGRPAADLRGRSGIGLGRPRGKVIRLVWECWSVDSDKQPDCGMRVETSATARSMECPKCKTPMACVDEVYE